ncbi:PTS transporter subunit EIIC [Longibaculum muris]|uniref:PTS transporter subunit EIIC n=1 Tax=Longibaculum muris TaxID=1796628 RepID=UPI0012B92AA7|nr:PTS transporter subunit EIIC [Longibaculum muris]
MKNIVKKTKSKSGENSFFSVIQRIGKAFFLPISVLPIAGILLGLGGSFTNQTTVASYNLQWLLGEGTILNILLTIMAKVGSAIFDNLPLIFALAIALSMAKREKAVAVLSSAIAFIVMHVTINAMLILNGYILADGTFSKKVLSGSVSSVLGITSLEMGVFGGIIVGLGVAALHNRFYKQKLPVALSFFSGVRFVPIISVLVFILVGIVSFYIWPIIQNGIFALGGLVNKSGYGGTFIFGFIERALIPFGLHHIFYLPFWQTALGGTAVIDGVTVQGAQNIFFAQLASPNTVQFSVEATRFMTGKYAFMMAGLPGAAYAMYKCAKPEKRKLVGGLLFSAALTTFLTGITEPIEFTFLFVAPALYLLHCVFAGLSFLLMHIFNICIGTTFSCGLIDFTLYGILQGAAKTNWPRLIPIFIIYALGYYFIFKFLILHFNLATPGRNDDEEVKLYTKEDYKNKKQSTDIIYQILLEGIGGIDNLIDIDACATRLRVTVNNMQLVDDDKLKSTGAKGILKKGTGIQIVYGPQVAVIKSEFEEFIDSLTNEQI